MEYLTFGMSYWIYTNFGIGPAALFFIGGLAVAIYIHKKVLYYENDLG